MTSERLSSYVIRAVPPMPQAAVWRAAASFSLIVAVSCLSPRAALTSSVQEERSHPTQLQQAVNVQAERLSSADVEERRDAVMRLRAIERPDASHAAAAALGDTSPLVRASAAHAVLALGGDEAALLVLPLLKDRDEFVRREAGYALGRTGSTLAVRPLIAALEADRSGAVRGAAAVALGQIGDPSAIPAVANSLPRRLPAPGFTSRGGRRRAEADDFVRRSAAVALGRIGGLDGGQALILALLDERSPDDLRREAAVALGLIGDPAAVPALRASLNSRDPHLARISFDSLRRLGESSVGPSN